MRCCIRNPKGKSVCWIYLPVVAVWLWASRHKDLIRSVTNKTLMLVKLTGETSKVIANKSL